MDTKQVGEKLVALCREGKNMEAVDALYAPNIVSIEAVGTPDFPAETRGIDGVRDKGRKWFDNHEVHSATADGPFPNNDRFAVKYHYDVTAKSGPAAGQRFNMDEVALYTVKDGKIVREEFFYAM